MAQIDAGRKAIRSRKVAVALRYLSWPRLIRAQDARFLVWCL